MKMPKANPITTPPKIMPVFLGLRFTRDKRSEPRSVIAFKDSFETHFPLEPRCGCLISVLVLVLV